MTPTEPPTSAEGAAWTEFGGGQDDEAVVGPLAAVLAEARRRSLIGSAPLDSQITHSLALLKLLCEETCDGRVLDLGSGGGLPGLVVASSRAGHRLTLLDSSRRATDFLAWAVCELDLGPRVEVVTARAEELAHDPSRRGHYDAVVSRSFGPPAVTAECAAGFLRTGARLIVAEPPAPGDGTAPSARRWPSYGCQLLGLQPERTVGEPFAFAVLRQVSPCPARYPRRAGIPAKRPLFGEDMGRGRPGLV